MEQLANVLKNTSVISLINAKPMRKTEFIFLQGDDTIRTALQAFITNEIKSIPIKKTSPIVAESEFIGILTLVRLLKFVFTFAKETSAFTLLDKKLVEIFETTDLIQTIEFINPQSSLMNLLLNVWGGVCKPKNSHIDCLHIISCTLTGKFEVITPLDFLRHLLFLNAKENACLRESHVMEIENGFDVDENYVTRWGEDLNVTIDRMVNSDPIFLLAIVDEVTGGLEGNITFSDLLPDQFDKIESSMALLRQPNLSLKTYLQSLRTSLFSSDPILLHPCYSILDLIEKLTKMKIHHLWRVSQDAAQRPLGAVGVADILRYLNFMVRPFEGEKAVKSENQISDGSILSCVKI